MTHSVSYQVVRLGAALALGVVLAAVASAADEATPASPSKPKEPASTQRTSELIKQLGDKDYHVRQRAQDELARLGFDAFDAVSEATTNPDLEIASRAKYLLRLMRIDWAAETDSPDVKQCLRNYEFDDVQAREAKIRALAALPGGQGITALCRLVRCEKSQLLSKTAAVALLASQMDAKPPEPAVIEAVRKTLGDCKRPGAVWLLAWTRLAAEPDAVMTQWAKLLAEEQQLLRKTPNETNPQILAGLTRFQIARLKKLGKTDEAMAAIRRLVDIDPGNPESLGELLDWLVAQKAWKAVDELAERFSNRLNREPGLLYALAEAQLEQGHKDQAEAIASRALQLFPGKQQRDLIRHLVVAQHLRTRGQFAWARREFEQVIKQGSDARDLRSMAQSTLAEMVHDQGQDLDAAGTLEKLVEALATGKANEAELNGRKPSEVRSRMYYFTACHWETQGDLAKRRESLDKALKADPSDIDVLIACYRLPDPTPEYRAKIADLIKKAAAETRQEIAEDPENPSPYNQLAWLLGNTEGDFDEAIRSSQKSLELLRQFPEMKQNEGGFRDTLAHAYFGKGDLENAVKQQTRAAELDPHSGLIQRELAMFRKKLAEKENKKP
jgi:tetratricopeptide (TPR) repeat protein